MNVRLSILMFLQYAVMGAWVPLFSVLMDERGFTPQETAWCFATSALGALLAPVLWGQIADRWFAAQKCISGCALACGGCLFSLAELREPLPVFLMSLVYWFFMYPVVSLGTALTFRHLADPQRQFGGVRMWGTIGWVIAGWLVGAWFQADDWAIDYAVWMGLGAPDAFDCLRLGGLLAIVLSFYALSLPDTPPSPPRTPSRHANRLRQFLEAPLLAFQLLRRRSLGVLCLCMFVLYVTIPFNAQLTPLLLRRLGVSERWLPVVLTLGQSLEIITLGVLPIILLRLEEKGTLLAGMFAWMALMTVLTLGQPLWLVIAVLGLNGVFICCFIVAGQMVVNRRAPADIRASAQGMLQLINGLGMLIGHVLVGWLRHVSEDDFSALFLVAAILSGLLIVLFLTLFTPPDTKPAATSDA